MKLNTLSAALIVTALATSAYAGKTPGPINVTATYRCGAAGTGACDGLDNIKDDLRGSYAAYIENGGNGRLRIDWNSTVNPSRSMYVDATQRIVGTSPTCGTTCRWSNFRPGYRYSGQLFVTVVDESGNTAANGAMSIAPGSSGLARVGHIFDDSNYLWTVRYDKTSTLYIGSDWATITRSADGKSWTVTNGAKASLQSSNTGQKVTYVDEGLFNVPFSVTFTMP